MSTPTTTVIFDGVCTLCNSTVDFLVRHDTNSTMRFGSFQQENVMALLRSHNIIEAPTTVYVITAQNTVLEESTAILYLGSLLGGWWKFMSVLAHIVPRPLRDVVYRWVAKNRYRWFGKRESCRVPTEAERRLFL
ncbi:MAG: DCC1-like thiol-disulfide oxidoreductase family protein [Candidatus Kapabacteria bacterium]|nr:DCC1-like thiol-disulfide oxidoreductase family protein [Candidatus Kapabacteria bacterium]